MSGYSNVELLSLIHRLEAAKLTLNGFPLMDGVRRAFQTKPFIYGTQGKKGGGLRMGGFLARAMNDRNADTRPKLYSAAERDNYPESERHKPLTGRTAKYAFSDDAHGYAFQTGSRQTVQRRHNYQMMDMYYGDGMDVGAKADPFILEFVCYAAKLKEVPAPSLNPWQQAKPTPSTPFMGHHRPNTTSNPPQFPGQLPPNGTTWQSAVPKSPVIGKGNRVPAPGHLPQRTGYMHPFNEFNKNSNEMGEWGKKGGWEQTTYTDKLYGVDSFRGLPQTMTKELSRIIRWCIQQFGGTIIFDGADVYYDQVFNNREKFGDTELEANDLFSYFSPGQSQAVFGSGKIIFHWHGQETVPSKLLFLTSWKWDKGAEQQWYKLMHPGNFQSSLTEEKFGQFPINAANPIETLVRNITVGRRNIWDKFIPLPNGVTWTNESISAWLEQMGYMIKRG